MNEPDSEVALVEAEVIDSRGPLKDQAWDLHLAGLSFRQIGFRLHISAATVSVWIKDRYVELGRDPKRPVDQLRSEAVARLKLITSKAYIALSELVPDLGVEVEGPIAIARLIGVSKNAPAIARLLETMTRVEEVRARVEGTFQGGSATSLGGGPGPDGQDGGTLVVRHEFVIKRVSALTAPAASVGLESDRSGVGAAGADGPGEESGVPAQRPTG